MGRGDAQLASAKQSYRKAKEVGNRQEEARWANVIGDILKNRGEYVEALKWVRIDYDLSVRYLPQKQVLPSCQSLGELYLRLQNFKDALIYQKKHLELAKDVDDLVEQQRAATQLGRTYHEMFTDNATVDDHYYLRNAKKYFKIAMKLAQKLKECPPDHGSSFIKEYVDAHNNIGMLEIDIDNLEGAERILIEGLNICDEEEVNENDDARSRLHHNLGNVYLELREWDKARVHIEKDIIICKEIGHCQGEAKGYINLGELHYRVQRYEEAIRCYRKALDLANSMEDEDALVSQIEANIETTRTAMKVMDEIKKEEQELKKLNRNISSSRGTSRERKCLMQHMSLLDSLIDKSSMLLAWLKHLEFAKQKKRITIELYDKEKVGDSFLALGESYWKLREFNKAIKWYTKGWETCKAITNLEGQAMAKINIGNVLDSSGDRKGALSSYEEAYRVAVEANLPDFQIQALENMHYIQMIRFDNTDEARRLRRKIEDLKATKEREVARAKVVADCCSETDSEDSSLNKSNTSSPKISKSSFTKSKSFEMAEGSSDDDEPLISLRSRKQPHRKTTHVESQNIFNIPTDASPRRMSESRSLQTVSRKRVRVILSGSDDEDDADNSMSCSKMRSQGCVVEDATASNKHNGKHVAVNSPKIGQDVSVVSSKCANSSRKLDSNEESSCSFKLKDHEEQCITFKIDDDLIHIKADFYHETGNMSIESVKVELACLYYLRLPEERRSKGLLPIIQHLYFSGKVLQSLEEFEDLKDDVERNVIDVSVSGWVQKRLMKLYIDCCKEILEAPNMKLLKRLYISEVEDEVVASECELQDISATPLLNALHIHKSVATLDISHNLLGNGTMEKLQHLFQSGPKYGDLTLNLHCNRFGPNALFQICECPILFTRLEVLNISGNRLTDSCGSYLSTIVEQCTALYSLSIEQCSITSRTIQKMANALHAGSNLGRLNIGYNDPISGQSVIHLLSKLSILKSFDELNMNGIKLNKSAVDALSELARTKGLSHLMVASSGVGLDGALQLTEAMLSGSPESVKMNLSYCGVTPAYIHKLNTTLFCGIIELNLGGNPLLREDACGLASFLMNPQCSIKVLVLDKCKLGCTGILEVIRALAGNLHLEEIYLAENVEVDTQPTQQHQDVTQPCMKISNILPNKKVDIMDMQDASAINNDRNQLEVADSEEATAMEGASDFDDACTSLRPRNSTLDAQCIDELSNAIGMAKHLQLLDLSRNGFSTQVAETLYNAWSIRSEAGVAHKHIKDQIIHLSVETNKCCRIKPCCKRN